MGFLYLLIFPNGKFYVGLTTKGSVHDRFAEHRSHAKTGKLKTAVYNAWRKHGEPTAVSMGEYPNDELPAREIHLIAALNTQVPNGYNLTEGGDQTAVSGWHHSEDAKARIIAAIKARPKKEVCSRGHRAVRYANGGCAHCALSQQKARYEANKDAIAEYKRAYYERNRELLLAKQKARYAANKEAVAEYKRAYYERNREVLLVRQKAWHAAKKSAGL